jgi:hypothetical protein
MDQLTSMPSQRIITTDKHYVTIGFGAWLIAGVFIDGFAHNHGVVETFFTPWHAILYSGFLASAVWMTWLLYRSKQNAGGTWVQAAPNGYGLGLIGVVVFLLGGLGDMGWHIIFGIEQNVAALLSPTHLVLLIGALLILSSPFRAAWNNPAITAPDWREFGPPFLSIVITTGAVSFFLMYAWMFRYNLPAAPVIDWYWQHYFDNNIAQNNEMRGLTYLLLNTLVFMYPVFLLMKRWTLPFGAIAMLFALLTTLMSVLDGFRYYPSIIIAFAAGLIGDILYRWLRPYEGRVWAYRMIAIVVPAALWSFYYLWMQATVGIGWSTELWSGSIVETALLSLGLNLLAISKSKD